MKLDTSRAKQIDAYLNNKEPLEHTAKSVELSGEVKKLLVYRVPIRLLLFNIRNGRFAAELLEKEEELKRKLDPTVQQDSKIIQKLLLEQSESETEVLKEDLRAHGQLDPGIITFDGAVIDANRRMAILKTLYDETSESRFEYLNVSRLPQGVDQKDLWRIEAGLQFAKDFRLEYGPINELLKLKEGWKQGLTPQDISKSLLGRLSEKKVIEKFAILKLIESYLSFIGKPNEYHLVQRNVEKFNSLQADVVGPLKKKGKKDSEIAGTIAVAFALIQKAPEITHWDIRDLRGIALNERAEKELAPILKTDSSGETSVEAFRVAQEIVEDTEQKDKPERLVKRALTAIKSISPTSSHLAHPNVKTMLKELKKQTEKLLKAK